MPRVSEFRGIAIYMYWNEGDHPVAHFHAHHGGKRASVSVQGELLAGDLDPAALRLVQQWAEEHWAELDANWERARRSQPLQTIAPLA